MMHDAEHDAQAINDLAAVFDDIRREHQVDVMQSNLLACTCGERPPIIYGEDGRPLYNPAIRHHHEQYARASIGFRNDPCPDPWHDRRATSPDTEVCVRCDGRAEA